MFMVKASKSRVSVTLLKHFFTQEITSLISYNQLLSFIFYDQNIKMKYFLFATV